MWIVESALPGVMIPRVVERDTRRCTEMLRVQSAAQGGTDGRHHGDGESECDDHCHDFIPLFIFHPSLLHEWLVTGTAV